MPGPIRPPVWPIWVMATLDARQISSNGSNVPSSWRRLKIGELSGPNPRRYSCPSLPSMRMPFTLPFPFIAASCRDFRHTPSAKLRDHVLAEAAHRLHDRGLRQIAVAHLAQHVVNARVAEFGDLLGDVAGRAAQRGRLERVAYAVLVGDSRIVPGIHAALLDVKIGRIVRRARVDHMAPRLEERPGQLVLGLSLALGDVDEAPERRLVAKSALPLGVEAALGKPGFVERQSLRHPRSRSAPPDETLRQIGGCGRWRGRGRSSGRRSR